MDKYEETLERAKKGLPIDKVSPELKESEDERVRKEMIHWLKGFIGEEEGCGYTEDEIRERIAYLEKQKEYVSDNFDDVWTTEDCAEIIEAGEKLSPRFKELFKEVCHAFFDKGVELTKKQKEQKSIEDVVKDVTKNKESATKFLKSAGIMDDNGELSEIYRSEQKPIEWSKDFEENIRILLHDKLTWRSKDGSISSLVVIDNKTLKDIVTGIWFYVGKEASKYPNKELKVEQKPAEKQSMLKKLREHLANTPKEQLDAEFEALKDLTIDKPAEWSKKDKECRDELIQYIEQRIGDNTTGQFLWKKWHSWLNSLPERFNLLPKQEWSEEDEKMLLSAIEYVQTYPAHRQSVVTWLKFLSERFNLQSQWKPSEEQIEALEWMLTTVSFKDGGYGVVLKNLINDLKKQM